MFVLPHGYSILAASNQSTGLVAFVSGQILRFGVHGIVDIEHAFKK